MRTSKLMTLGLCCLSLLSGCNSKNNKRVEYKGTYHAGVVNGVDYGAVMITLLNSDGSIYTITEDTESPYEISSNAIVWGIRNNPILANIATCSVADIKTWTVTKDENGIPTAISGMNQDWINDAIIDGIGMSILALQDAFKAL